MGLNYDTIREATLATALGDDQRQHKPDSFTCPKTHSFSVSYARRIFFNQVVEATYVGTRGRDLVSRVNPTPFREGALLQRHGRELEPANPIQPRTRSRLRRRTRPAVPAYPASTTTTSKASRTTTRCR